MSGPSIKVKGTAEVLAKLRRFDQKARDGLTKGLRTWGEATMSLIKENEVPIRLGILKASGVVEPTEDKLTPLIELSFGGEHPASGYAITVHEIPANHQHGRDKYLEAPSLRESKKLPNDVGNAVKRATGM